MSGKIASYTDANFPSEVLRCDQPVLVDFWAEWCKPCLALAPTVEALAEQLDGKLRVGKVNVDENPNVPGQYNIMSIPTLLLFKGGQVVEQRVGLVSKESLIQLIEPHLS